VLTLPSGLGPTTGHAVAGVLLMVGNIALYGRLVVLASARSRRQFAPTSRRGLWGWPFDRLAARRDLPPT
jgi:hypothetical protein